MGRMTTRLHIDK